MKLLYFEGNHPNFGDDLNKEIWPLIAPELFVGDTTQGFLGIGTLIGRPFVGVETVHVFSSGVGYDQLKPAAANHRFWCVRGPLSARALGLDINRAIVDGGVLAPELLGIRKAAITNPRPAVVPHWQSILFGGWREACNIAGFELVDPTESPRNVIAQLAAAPLVITESLHGAVIADTLRIPWLAIVTTANVSLFKWFDWASSVKLPLRMTVVHSPTQTTLRQFGRARLGASGFPVTVPEAQAFADFAERGMVKTALLQRAVSGTARIVRGLKARLDENVNGISPARTARALRSVSTCEPQLSEAGVIDDLKTQLRTRLDELRADYAHGTQASRQL